jgi:mRNA-degrading endonuclease RelE of RelBE toxin-antitoxin system
VIWQIEWTEQASKDLGRLDRQIRDRVLRAIDRYDQTGHGDLVRLKGPGQRLRLRVGDWRVGLTLDHAALRLRVHWVLPRDRAYRD